MRTVLAALAAVTSLFTFQFAHASILPPNDLHMKDCLACEGPSMTEQQFNAIIEDVAFFYRPVVSGHGATLVMNKLWTNSTVNASAQQMGNEWIVNMYGGLARRPEVTPDGFALVVCHELGHHLGGMAFYGNDDWAASEGQSDYFATQACARRIWRGATAVNATFRATAPADVKSRCSVWQTTANQNLCYRTAAASQSLANLLSALNSQGVPKVSTPDRTQVATTQVSHPRGQCRLDTYIAGATCKRSLRIGVIPGKDFFGAQNGPEAEEEAAANSCHQFSGYSIGLRPRCWFKPGIGK